MTGFIKCRGGTCPWKDKCLRYTSKILDIQYLHVPFDDIGDCSYYWNEELINQPTKGLE